MPLPTQRDRGELRERLQAWLAARVAADAAPELSALSIPEGTGMSSETLLFDATWREDGQQRGGSYVARMAPDMNDFPVFAEYDLALQYECLRFVAERSDVPVPGAPWLELDSAPLGAPFFVMERVEGNVPPDVPPYVFAGWVMDATPAQRERLQRSAVEVLAKLHALDVSGADAAFLDRPAYGASALEQHLAYQRFYYDWARKSVEYPILERTFEWLEKHKPVDDQPAVLNWGDARIGNMMFRDFEPVAVLDWEMASLGARETDLAWMAYMHEFFADLARTAGQPGIADFMQRDALASLYTELTGQRVRDLEFYEVFAGLRYGIVSIRIGHRGVAYGQMEAPEQPDGYIMNRGIMERMLSGEFWE